MSGRFDLLPLQGADGISLSSEAGFRMLKGRARIVTERGQSRPSSATKQGMAHRVHVKRLGRHVVELWQEVQNTAADPLEIREITLWDGLLELDGSGWRVFHPELYKGERYFGGYSFVTNGLFGPMPETEGLFGLSEDTPFPGIWFTHPERGTVLISVLRQERCAPCWTLRRRGRASELTLREAFGGIPAIPVPAGGTFSGERWVILSVPGGVREALDEYYRLLRQRIEFPGAHSILREAIVWGTWNYNVRPRGHGDITHDYVAANARALRTLAPEKPRFVMIDDGWQRGKSLARRGKWSFCSGLQYFHADGGPAHDAKLFPKGMKGMADAIRKAGAEPAIWITPSIDRTSSLGKAHPEWLLQLAGDRQFIEPSHYLDYSLPEVREFTRKAWHTITREWGYKGIKLDFWTPQFEVPHVRYRNRDRTAIELRNQFLRDLRELVPPDGYVITCCTTNAGNPFLGRYAESSRAGNDVGDGDWSLIWDGASWMTVSSLFYRDDALLADPDSFGYSTRATLDENRLWATVALFSGGMCEIGGDLTKLSPEARRLVSTGIAFHRPRKRAWNDALDAGISGLPSGHWTMERSDGTWEAWLNPATWPRLIHLPSPKRELWTGKMIKGDFLIPRHGAVVFRS
jgi:hypothetical protein